MTTRSRWCAAALVFAIPSLFAIFTNHVWEDYYITFRASKNLAQGHGLAYQIGEHVHSFTSPLGVLLPAVLSYLTHSDAMTLWFFRLLCCASLSGAVYLLWQMLEAQGSTRLGCWLVTLLLLADSKLVDFTINGMETPFMVLFVAWLLQLVLQSPAPRPFTLGAVLAGLMWTRPDAFVVGLAIVAAAVIFTCKSWVQLLEMLALLAKAAVVAALLYGPWVAFAWWYYGSPVPHTIIAKSGAISGSLDLSHLWMAPLNYLSGRSTMSWLLNPSYFFMGGWPNLIIYLGDVLSIVAGFLWLIPKLPGLVRVASLGLFLGSYYLQAVPPAPWYFPIWQVLAAVSLGGAAAGLMDSPKVQPIGRSLARIAIAILLVVQFSTVGLVAWQVRQQQLIIEGRGRRAIGEWLATNASPKDTVFLEPLGYIGYFSQLHMLDFPGLCAKSVVSARATVGDSYDALIKTLRPTWIVLRTRTVQRSGVVPARLFDQYDYVTIWDNKQTIDAISFLPGRGLLEFDVSFVLYRRDHPSE